MLRWDQGLNYRLVICDLRVKFKVSQTNIFQETKRLRVVIFHELEFIQKVLKQHYILRNSLALSHKYSLLRNISISSLC